MARGPDLGQVPAQRIEDQAHLPARGQQGLEPLFGGEAQHERCVAVGHREELEVGALRPHQLIGRDRQDDLAVVEGLPQRRPGPLVGHGGGHGPLEVVGRLDLGERGRVVTGGRHVGQQVDGAQHGDDVPGVGRPARLRGAAPT